MLYKDINSLLWNLLQRVCNLKGKDREGKGQKHRK